MRFSRSLTAAWLAFATAIFAPTVQAAEETNRLYTSSVAYCSPPVAILVNDLSLELFPSNNTLQFSLSAASIQDNLNVSIALNINAYGLGLINVNIDLCTLAAGILCPLPQYQFSGSGIFPVPEQISSEIPGIAYKIPDLEAVATLQLTDTSDNQVVGCVQATLSNGHTAKQSGVLWATVGLALLALFSSLLHTVIAQSIGAAQWRVVDVMWAIQLPAIASLLSLNYPTVFLQYGANFAWSIGLVNIPSLQSSITQTRARTGGHDQAVFGRNLTAVTARRTNFLSEEPSSPTSGSSISAGSLGLFAAMPQKQGGVSADASIVTPTKLNFLSPLTSFVHIDSPEELLKRQQYAPNTGPGGSLLGSRNDAVSLPLIDGNGTINGGIGTFAERNYVAPSNAFLTVLVSMAILLAIFLGAVLLVYLIALVMRMLTSRANKAKGASNNLSHWSQRVTRPHEFLTTVALASLGRYMLVVFPIFFIFAFWQWVDGDSWVGHLVAALMTVAMLAFAALFFVPLIRHARRGTPADLYHDQAPPAHGPVLAKRWGHMAHPYRPKFYWFAAALLAWSILRACFISFAPGHGTRQAIGLLVAEVLLFVTLCVLRVGRDKKSDFVFILLCFSRVAAWAVCVVFIPSANVRTIPRVIVGFVLLVVTALPIVFLFFLTLFDLVTPFLPSKRRDVSHTDGDLEKDQRASGQQSASDIADERSAAVRGDETGSVDDGQSGASRHADLVPGPSTAVPMTSAPPHSSTA